MINEDYIESFAVYTNGTQATNLLDLGYITLRCKGRSFIIDTGTSHWFIEDGTTRTEYKLVFIEDDEFKDFDDSDFDLSNEDLLDGELVVTVWVDGEEFEDEIMSMTLTVDVDGTIRDINCIEE